MSASKAIAKPYARALFELATDKIQRGQWLHRLQVLGMVFQDREIQKVVGRMPPTRALEWLRSVLGDGIDAESWSLLALLLQYKRLNSIGDIRFQFADLMVELHGFGVLFVTSAVKLDDAEHFRLLQVFEGMYKQKLIPHFRVDPVIRGGVVGRVKDLVYDGSLRGSLDKLRENLIQ